MKRTAAFDSRQCQGEGCTHTGYSTRFHARIGRSEHPSLVFAVSCGLSSTYLRLREPLLQFGRGFNVYTKQQYLTAYPFCVSCFVATTHFTLHVEGARRREAPPSRVPRSVRLLRQEGRLRRGRVSVLLAHRHGPGKRGSSCRLMWTRLGAKSVSGSCLVGGGFPGR